MNTKYQGRIRERHFWFRIGVAALLLGVLLFIVVSISIFTDTPFTAVSGLLGLALLGMLFGILSTVLFSRIGWSQSAMLDLLLNRVSILLTITGLGFGWGSTLFEVYWRSKLLSLGQVFTIIGIILVGLGIRFQSKPPGLE
jgi:hypothetical protein